MSNIVSGMNIAKSALTSQMTVLNTTANNIANADTPGYTRQTALLSPVPDYTGSSAGSGVEVSEIQSYRSAYYDEVYRNKSYNYNEFSQTEQLMSQLELVFNEPSDSGFSATINSFFNAWQDVANDPTSLAARENLKSLTTEMTDNFHLINSQLQTMQEDINSEIETVPGKINEITSELAELNKAISTSDKQVDQANGFKDKRDQLVDDLSEYGNVKVVEQKDNTYTVYFGDKILVEQDNQYILSYEKEVGLANQSNKTVLTTSDGAELNVKSGKLGALSKFRDKTITDIVDKLNTMAESIVTSVNAQHKNGYGLDGTSGRNYFDPEKTSAYNITLSSDVDNNGNIASSLDPGGGGNEIALNISDIGSSKTIQGKYSVSELYNTMIVDIGTKSSQAQSQSSNSELLFNQAKSLRESVSGVNIDEELINMIQTQRIYQSASRLISVYDSLYQSLLNI